MPMRSVVLLALLAAVPAAFADQSAPVSSIRVSGNAKVTTKPDRAQIDLGVQTRAATSQAAAADNARTLEAVLAAAKSAAGTGAVLKTVSYSLYPNYHSRVSSAGEPTIDSYTATNVVRVTLDDLSKVGGVIDAATRAGANDVQGIQFTLRDEDAVKSEALRQAARQARAKADVLADTLGLKVTRVLEVSENGVNFAPMYARPRAMAATASASVATPVETGTLDVTADVSLTVEVAPAR
jgi:uncharacterized protein YggE